MEQKMRLSLDVLPEAAVLLRNGTVLEVNAPALSLLPRLQPGASPPEGFPQAPGKGSFSAQDSFFDYRCAPVEEALLVLFYPASQNALTGRQLQLCLAQLQELLSSSLASRGHPRGKAAQDKLRRDFFRQFRLLSNLELLCQRPDAPILGFSPRELDLDKLCREVLFEAGDLLAEQGVLLDYHSEVRSAPVYGDNALLKRALLELIANAVQVIHQGQILLRLERVGQQLLLYVEDSGGPLSPRRLASLLQQEPEGAIPLPGSGAGLGLSVVRRIMQAHRGAFLIQTQEGRQRPVLVLPRLTQGESAGSAPCTMPVLTDGGLSPLLVALSPVLPPEHYTQEQVE